MRHHTCRWSKSSEHLCMNTKDPKHINLFWKNVLVESRKRFRGTSSLLLQFLFLPEVSWMTPGAAFCTLTLVIFEWPKARTCFLLLKHHFLLLRIWISALSCFGRVAVCAHACVHMCLFPPCLQTVRIIKFTLPKNAPLKLYRHWFCFSVAYSHFYFFKYFSLILQTTSQHTKWIILTQKHVNE